MGQDLGGDLPDTGVPLQIEAVLAIGKSGLGKALQLHRPGQPPLVCVHRVSHRVFLLIA